MRIAPVFMFAPLVAAATVAWPLAVGAVELASFAHPGPSAPQIDWFAPVYCVDHPDGKLYRIQCVEGIDTGEDTRLPTCLVALDRPSASAEPLRRTRPCTDYWAEADLENFVHVGYQFVAAKVEAPPGWARDELGRVMQVSFDLFDRFYLGAGWLPSINHREVTDLSLAEPSADTPSSELDSLGRVRFDMGFQASVHDPSDRSRYTFRSLEGSVAMAGLELDGLLFGYDYSHDYRHPLLRITSFFGRPRRHDVGVDIGWGLSLLDVRARPGWRTAATWLDFGELHVGWDIWQSRDLYNHLRFETGGGLGSLWQENVGDSVLYGTTQARVEGRFGLDRDGFHYLYADAIATMHTFVSGGFVGQRTLSGRASLAYEVVFLAVNDQPLSLRLEAATERAEALRGLDVWSTTFTTALRFSFWAPAQTRHLTQQQSDALY